MPRKTIPSHRPTRDPKDSSKTILIPVRSHFWNEEGFSFRKCFDVLLDLYTEPHEKEPPLLDYVHVGWYCKFQRMFWKNEAFTLREVQTRYGIAPATFTSYVDRLEDVELLDREKCIDLQGQPVDLLIRTPYSVAKFMSERAHLQKRVQEKFTATRRAGAGGSKATGYPAHSLNIKERLARIENEQRDANMKKMQEIVDYVRHINVGRNDEMTEKQFVAQVKQTCINWKVFYSDKLLREAIGQFRRQ
jgi:hypothetical protein